VADTKSLKDQNAWLVRSSVIGHITAFMWVAFAPPKLLTAGSSAAIKKLEAVAVPGSAAIGIIVIASLLLLGLIPPYWRDRLIHLKWHNPLPGCRAFTEIGPKSNHVDMQLLEAKCGPLPTDPGDQNKLFYKIYLKVRDEVGVLDAHRRYLAARDIGTIAAILTLALPILAWIATQNASRSALYALGLAIFFILCAVAAKNYSRRMVQHVLALT
jgi:hypothetical protein